MSPRLALLCCLLGSRALAASLDLANDPATGGPGRFAAEEIRREAASKGMTMPDSHFERLLAARHPRTASPHLFRALQVASQVMNATLPRDHASYLGLIDSEDASNCGAQSGAAELRKAFAFPGTS